MDITEVIGITVILKVDYNIPTQNDVARIKRSIPTIKKLLEQNNKVVIATHYGRPEGKYIDTMSTNLLKHIIVDELQRVGIALHITHVDQFALGFPAAKDIIDKSEDKIYLLENTRFVPEETSNDTSVRETIANNYSSLANIAVNEAFSLSHRSEATNTELMKILPSTLGINYREEVSHLDIIKSNTKKPFVVIMGGAKPETKLQLIQKMCEVADYVLLGGSLCFPFVRAKSQMLNEPKESIELFDSARISESFIPQAVKLLQQFGSKIILPLDFVYIDEQDLELKQQFAGDIGVETRQLFAHVINDAKSIFWNGPLGWYEKESCREGSEAIAQMMEDNTGCYTVVGGGDTEACIPKQILPSIDWVSTGGGATLEYITK
jgi:phosphoglycerate kinase